MLRLLSAARTRRHTRPGRRAHPVGGSQRRSTHESNSLKYSGTVLWLIFMALWCRSSYISLHCVVSTQKRESVSYLSASMNLLLLSEYRMVSGSHCISRRCNFGQFCDREMIIWSMWTLVLMRRNQPFAVPHTSTLSYCKQHTNTVWYQIS